MLEDNPYGLLRYEGEPLPTLYALDGGEYVIYLGTFSKILSPGLRLGWAAAPRPVLEKLNLGKQARRPLLVDVHAALRRRRTSRSATGASYSRTLRELYRRRRDVMLDALAEHLPPEATWTRPQGGLFIWATLPDYIDTTDLLARALREHVAFVPGRAAFLDGRGGSSMRLNFSGVGEDDIREGVRRIGKVVREQVALYSTLTGHPPAARAAAEPAARRGPPTCCAAAPPRAGARADADEPRRASCKGGRSLERQVSLRSGARVEDALERLGHDVVRSTSAPTSSTGCASAPGRRVRRAARPRRRGRHRPGAARGARHPVHRLGRVGLHAAAWTRCWPSTLLRDAGIPTPDFYAFSETAFEELGAAEALPAIEERLDFPIVVKPACQGSALGIKFAPRAADVPGALVAAFSYDDEGAARALRRRAATSRCRCSTAAGRGAAGRRGGPARGGLLRLRGALRDRPHELRLPGGARRRELTARAQELALASTRALGCAGFARVDLMLDASTGELHVLEANAIPGLTETSPAPAGRRGGGDRRSTTSSRGSLELALARRRRALLASPAKSSGVTWSRNSLNLSTTSSVSSTSCSNSIADSAMTSSAAKIGAPERTASASASLGRESISTSRPFTASVIDA